MCQISPPYETFDGSTSCELRAFSSLIVYGHGRRDVLNSRKPQGLRATVLLGVVCVRESNFKESWAAKGFIALDTGNQTIGQREFKPRKVDQSLADFEILKSWMKFCQEHHGKQCAFQERDMKPLWLIDCHTRKIFATRTKEKYAALSYVWGKPIPSSYDFGMESLPESLPRTIEDAMRTTILIGLRYLWVDRYCIPQNDNEERHIQISQMDRVYRSAEITIIAAARDGPTYGLPGMGSAMRTPQQTIQTSAGMLISTLPDGKFAIEESLWNTRGWTYQEAILSRRRLVFTRHQIYFQCNGMHCCESIEKPLDILHVKTQQKLRAWNGDGPFVATGLGSHPWEILHRIAEYSKRELTYESDVLNAVTGILSEFKRMKRPVYHHFGVPSLPPVLNTQTIGKAFGKLVSLKTLPNNSDHGLATGLCWYLERPSARRAKFPSWSWTGWTGWTGHVAKPTQDHLQYYFGFQEGHLDVKIWVELEDGSVRRWQDEVMITESIIGHQHSQYLHLEVNTIMIQRIVETSQINRSNLAENPSFAVEKEPRFHAEIAVNDTQQEQLTVRCELTLTHEVAQESTLYQRPCNESWCGILFGCQYLEPKRARSRGAFVMVIDYIDGYWERIGHLNIVDIEIHWENKASRLSFSVSKQIIRLG